MFLGKKCGTQARPEITENGNTSSVPHSAGQPRELDPGEVLFGLLTRSDWVHRQVDAIKIEDDGRARRKVSFDLTVPAVLPIWKHGDNSEDLSLEPGQEQLAVPLGFLEKKVTQGLDVTLDGKSLPVLTTSQNIAISKQVLSYLVGLLPSISGADHDMLSALIDQAVGYGGAGGNSADPSSAIGKALTKFAADNEKLDEREAAALLALKSYLLTLTANYLFLVLVPASLRGQRVVIKYSRDQENRPHRTPWFKKLKFSYELPLSWRTASHHFEIDLPKSLEIVQMTFNDPGARGSSSRGIANDRVGIPIESKSAKAHLVLPSGPNVEVVRSRSIYIYAVPTGQGIRKFTMVSAIAVFVLVALSAVDRFLDVFLSESFTIPSTSVSLVLIGPALLISWMARSREHPIVEAILKPLRIILISMAASLIAMATLAAVPVTPGTWSTVWGVVYLVTSVSCCYAGLLAMVYRKPVTVSSMIYDR